MNQNTACLWAGILLFTLSTTICLAQDQETDLTGLEFEELLNIEVTSVSKKEQKVSEAPVAIFVISQREIRRSGATSIPELLRMVPGLNVAQIDSNKWAISSRGFNGRFANKLLVLIDGRTVYTPLFSGVYWEVQDTLLEDIERIEVIRGPGATLWGANAVNGVINIITKRTRVTQGTLLSSGGGSEEQGFASARYGGRIDENTHFRAYGKYFNRDDFVFANGSEAVDDWEIFRAGFRVDKDSTRGRLLTFSGDIYSGTAGDLEIVPDLTPQLTRLLAGEADVSGGNVLGRWTQSFSNRGELVGQVYYDRLAREDVVHRETRDTFDVDFQHHFPLRPGHELIWGAGYRYTNDDLSGLVSFTPSSRQDHLVNAFVQDEVSFLKSRLRLTIGSKFEHNSYTGFEIQPGARILWLPTRKHSIWAAVSRAVRTPARFEDDARIDVATVPTPQGLLALTVLSGNRDASSENLIAYEAGYRVQPRNDVNFDLALFYNDYRQLRTFETGTPQLVLNPPVPHIEVPLRPDNKMKGHTYGLEISTNWNPVSFWKWSAAYSWLQMQLSTDLSSTDTASTDAEGDSPRNQFHVRSQIDLPHRFEFDTALYYVDHLFNQDVSSYVRLDARVGWVPNKNLECSLVFQNLLDDHHREFGTSILVFATEIQRSIYGKITVRF